MKVSITGHDALRGAIIATIGVILLLANAAHADTTITSNISATTTWDVSGGVYIIQNSVSINPGVTLTINPGVIVKFKPAISLTVNGILNAGDIASSSVHFTSFKDDSVGGDTNGDGSATSPAAGDWLYIKVSSGATTTMSNVVMRYGGNGNQPLFWNAGGIVSISNSEVASSTASNIYQSLGTSTISGTVIHHAALGISLDQGGMTISSSTIRNNTNKGITSGGDRSSLSIVGTTFTNNTYEAAYINMGSGLALYQTGNTASGNSTNGITILGSITKSQTWAGSSLPYVISGSITLPSGTTLSLNPGVIVKFLDTASKLDVNGTLNALGTSGNRVYLTSVKDDSVGGDTNASATNPAAGNWDCIKANSGATISLEYAVVAYGGYSCSSAGAEVYNNGGYTSVVNSEIASSSANGLLLDSGSMDISGSEFHHSQWGISSSNGTTTVTASTIRDNTLDGLYGSGTGALTVATTTFSNNSRSMARIYLESKVLFRHWGNDELGTGGSYRGFTIRDSIANSQTWNNDGDIPYILDVADFSIPAGKALTLEPGVVVKPAAQANKITVNGGLNALGTPGAKVYFTSLKDDEVGGDTNSDSGATSPAAGNWSSIDIQSGASTTLSNAVVRYVGYSTNVASIITAGTLNVYDSMVATTSYYGIYQSAGTSTITGTDIHNTGWYAGIRVLGGTTTIKGTNIYSNVSGIRTTGTSVTVDACDIHNNTNGVLVDGATSGQVVVKSSRIYSNTYGVYIDSSTAVPTFGSNSFHNNTNYGVYKASGSTVPAEYNYWGSSSGPTTGSPTPPRDRVSSNVTYSPYLTAEHYLEVDNSGNLISSVDLFNDIDWDGDPGIYAEAWYHSINTWNELGHVTIATTTWPSVTDLTVSTTTAEDLPYAAYWQYQATTTDVIKLNEFYMSGYSETKRENVLTHEFGHALGLDHSYWASDGSGNIMHYLVMGTTTLGLQDKTDYYYLHP